MTSSKNFSKTFLLAFSGELSIKGRGTRNRFTDRLVKNLVEALESEGLAHRVERSWSRLFLIAESDAAGEVAKRVFGVHEVYPAEVHPWSVLEDLLEIGERVFTPQVRGRTFAVRVKKGTSRQTVPFHGPDAERALGERLFPHARGVDLKSPELEARIELHGSRAYFYGRGLGAFGGLPVGTEGRVAALVSGGFDSIVATWLMLRRGVQVEPIFCNLGGDGHQKAALEVMKVVADRWSYGSRPQVHLLDFRPVVEEIQKRCPQRLWQVLLKRRMIQAAEQIARRIRVPAIVTGDAVGQVSSQTVQNLSIVTAASEIPILRPVLTDSKDEIVHRARQIGVFELAARVPEYCAIAPKNPDTHAKIEKVLAAESRLDPETIEVVVRERAVCDLRALDLNHLEAPELAVDTLPEGAVVVDLRSEIAFKSWHPPEAVRLGYVEALAAYRSFAPDRPYVFYCEVGLKSAHLAELMKKAGFEAYHVRGGLKTLIQQEAGERASLLAPSLR